jgi:hypothetical protein
MPAQDHGIRALPLLAAGGVCGLAWAAGLRGFMAALAGPDSQVTWYGTFGQILLPGVVTGLLLGWAEYLRRTGGRRRWRWLALAPLAFVVALFATPETFSGVPLAGGIGGGAIAIPLFGMAGGYALSGRGPRWSRLAAGALFLVPVPAWAFSASVFGPGFALSTARGAWIAVLFWSAVAVLALACAIPHRPVLGPGQVEAPAGEGHADRAGVAVGRGRDGGAAAGARP